MTRCSHSFSRTSVNVSNILSGKEQEGILHHACREGDMFVVHTVLEKSVNNKHILPSSEGMTEKPFLLLSG